LKEFIWCAFLSVFHEGTWNKPELENAQDPHIIKKSFIGVFSYLVGAGAAWISIYAGFFMYLITPLLFIVPPEFREAENMGKED